MAVVLFALVVTGCTATSVGVSDSVEAAATVTDPIVTVANQVNDSFDGGVPAPGEIDDLLWVREEEKLAHDVYVALFERWQLTVFENISRAETQHAESVIALLDQYGIDDPADGLEDGVFVNPEIQALYDELVERGNLSVVDALEVGAYVEEMDILDLRARETGVAEIQDTYERLERGSHNHLRAFVRNLERRDAAYVPVLLGDGAFQEIIAAPAKTDRPSPDDGGEKGGGPRWRGSDS